MFEIETKKDKSRIKIKTYNELADYVYSNLKINDMLVINGYLDSNLEVIAKCIERLI